MSVRPPWWVARPESEWRPRAMSAEPAAAAAEQSSEYLRVKRKRTTLFLYADMPTDTVHDLRARVNLVTKVPTTDIKFFLDESGDVELKEDCTLKEQKVSIIFHHPHWP